MNDKIEKAVEIAKSIVLSLKAYSDMQKAAQSVVNLRQSKALYAGFDKPSDDMDEELSFILGRIRSNLGATDLQQVTQAVLHLMQAKAIGEETQPQQAKATTKKLGAGA